MRPFYKLALAFLETHRIDASMPEEEALDSLAFTHEGLTCKVYPDADESVVLVEVQVAEFDSVPEHLRPQLLHLLHGLNAAARLTHRAVATLDEDDRIVVYGHTALEPLTAQQLAMEMTGLLDSARHLRGAIELLVNPPTGDASSEPGTDGATMPFIDHA